MGVRVLFAYSMERGRTEGTSPRGATSQQGKGIMTLREAIEELSAKGIIITKVRDDAWLALRWPPTENGAQTIAAGDTWQEVYKQVSKKPRWRMPESV